MTQLRLVSRVDLAELKNCSIVDAFPTIIKGLGSHQAQR